MKTQVQNQGELKELKVMIEKEVVESFDRMSKVSGVSVADLVVIALKRYRSSHSDWDVKSINKDK
jgi:fructose-1,6-bisphosphatase/sedoheptulose 1,7-bisphosphatase-like protein